MDTQNFVNNLISKPTEYFLSDYDRKKIQQEGVSAFILAKLISSQYRASKIPEDLLEKVVEKVNKSISKNLPIHITVPFGGFKKWQLPTYPNVDWAEVFNIIYLCEYLYPITLAYKPGVILNYYSDEIFIQKMNNYPQAEVDEYNNQFAKLLRIMQKSLPTNFKLQLSKIRDEISQEEILRRFEKTTVKLKSDWKNLPKEEQAYRLNKAERNYKGNFESMSEEEKSKAIFDSTLVHDAFIFGDWDKDVPWAFGEYMIALGFRYTGSWGIHVRSSQSSTVQFWVGTGVLHKHKDRLVPGILSYKQYQVASGNLTYEKIDVFPKTFISLSIIPVLTH